MPVDNLMITGDSQQFTLQHEHLSGSQTQGHCCHKNIVLVFQGCASLFVLEYQQTFKFEDCLVWSKRLGLKTKYLLRGFRLLLLLPTWGNNLSKNTSTLYSRNGKNMRHRWQHKAITKTTKASLTWHRDTAHWW